MSVSSSRTDTLLGRAACLWPGIALSAVVAVAAFAAEPAIKLLTGGRFTLPAMVIALLIGIALHRLASQKRFEAGMVFCVKKLLRYAVALLGLRVALGDIAALGLATAVIVIVGMTVTTISGFWLARLLGREEGFGALAGAATAVCGASATLATSTVVPDYKGKAADVAFVVVAVNALSTLAMIAYPALCLWLGFDAQLTGVMLGATIHDVAQVVGAGYAVSDPVGNTAVVVKLFRVFLLLPVVLAIGFWFRHKGKEAKHAQVPVPVFALVFLALCLVNSVMPLMPSLMPVFEPIKLALGEASKWGLLIAIGALGLGTSFGAVAALGLRHVVVVCGTTLVILVVATAGLLIIR